MEEDAILSEEERYVDEFGQPLPRYEGVDLDKRGKFSSFPSALDFAFEELVKEHDDFFDVLPDIWPILFPNLAARPGRYEDGKIFLYVENSGILFAVRRKIPSIRKKLLELNNAPKRIELRLEIHPSRPYRSPSSHA